LFVLKSKFYKFFSSSKPLTKRLGEK